MATATLDEVTDVEAPVEPQTKRQTASVNEIADVEEPPHPSTALPSTGLLTPGTIKNLYNRPVLKNPDGSVSSTSSSSWDFGGKEVLLPTVVDGKRLTDKEAQDRYRRTGEHLGIFDTPEHADAYAQALHEEQARRMGLGPPEAKVETASINDIADVEPPETTLSMGGKPYVSGAFTPEEAAAIGQSQPAQQFPGPLGVQPPPVAPPQPTAGGPERPPAIVDPDAAAAFGEIAAPAAEAMLVKPTLEGPPQVVKGMKALAAIRGDTQWGQPTRAAFSDVLEGTFKTATPIVATAMLTNPVTTALYTGSAMAANEAASRAVKALGGTDEDARLAGNLAALAVGVKGADALLGAARKQAEHLAVLHRQVQAFDAAHPDLAPGYTPPVKPAGRGAAGRLLPETAETPSSAQPPPPTPPPAAPVEPGSIDTAKALQDLATNHPQSMVGKTAFSALRQAGWSVERIGAEVDRMLAQQAQPAPVDEAGRPLGGYPGPERRGTEGGVPPEGVPERRIAPAPADAAYESKLATERARPDLEAATVGRETATADQIASVEPPSPAVAEVSRGLSENLRGATDVVKAPVRSRIMDAQVLDPVIQSIPIDVVDMLGGKQGTAQVLLHDPSVLVDLLASNRDEAVGPSIDTLRSSIADTRAELGRFRPSDSGAKYEAALETLDSHLREAVVPPLLPASAAESERPLGTARTTTEPTAALAPVTEKGVSTFDASKGLSHGENIVAQSGAVNIPLKGAPETAQLPTVGKPAETGNRPISRLTGEEGQVSLAPLAPVATDIKSIAHEIGKVVSDVKNLISPQTASSEAQSAADKIRLAKAKAANEATIQRLKYTEGVMDRLKRMLTGRALEPVLKTIQSFEKMPEDARIAAISAYERTGQFPNAPAYSELYRASMDLGRDLLRQAYGDVGYVENYVRRQFVFGSEADEAKGTEYLRTKYRTLSANRSPTKSRVLDMPLDEALADMRGRGIDVKPASTNPEELRQWSLANAHQAAAFAEARERLKGDKQIHFVPIGRQGPRDEVAITDHGMAAFAPKERGLGTYYADPNVARILNNATSRGLTQYASFRAIRLMNASLNEMQLGLSAFHATGTTINGGLVDLSTGVRRLARAVVTGKLSEAAGGAAAVGRSVVPFVSVGRYLVLGRSLVNGLKTDAPEAYQFLNESLNPAGGRLQMEARYATRSIKSMKEAWQRGSILGAGIRVPFAVVEAGAKLLMQYAIPRIKLGVLMDRIADIKRRMPDATPQELHRAYAAAQDQIDNIFGLLIYDNGFWDKTAQDLAQVSTRSVGWTGGSLRWGIGAMSDALKAVRDLVGGGAGRGGGGRGLPPGPPEIPMRRTGEGPEPHYEPRRPFWTDRVLDAFVLPIYVGMIGAVYMYLHTGKTPKDEKDLYHPENGRLNDEGGPSRTNLPTYMKDVESYRADPFGTLLKKQAPLPEEAWSLWRNRNYWDDMIWDPNDPRSQQLKDAGEYILKETAPFSITQGLVSKEEAGGRASQVEAFFGFTKAPRSVTQTPAELALHEMTRMTHTPRTPTQVQKADLRTEVRKGMSAKATPEAKEAAKEAIKSGDLSKGQIKQAEKSAARRETALQYGLVHQSFVNSLQLYEAATPQERAGLKALLMKKAHTAILSAAPNERSALYKRYAADIHLQVATR